MKHATLAVEKPSWKKCNVAEPLEICRYKTNTPHCGDDDARLIANLFDPCFPVIRKHCFANLADKKQIT